jgi:regulator of protease activity HflC (stomatin/prohibitin superfamily)
MDRDQQIASAAMYRCGKTIHHFNGGSKTYESISRAKKAVGPKASCVAERPGEALHKRMQARWEAEEARQKAEAERKAAEEKAREEAEAAKIAAEAEQQAAA